MSPQNQRRSWVFTLSLATCLLVPMIRMCGSKWGTLLFVGTFLLGGVVFFMTKAKYRKTTWTIVGIWLLFCIFCFWQSKSQKKTGDDKPPAGTDKTITDVAVERPKRHREYVFIWRTQEGEYYQGRDTSGPMRTELIERTSTSLVFYVYYYEFGSPEFMRIQLSRGSQLKSWTGTWSQENPPCRGYLTLDEIGNETWSGSYWGAKDPDQKFRATIKLTN